MNAFFKGLTHLFVSTVAVGGTAAITSGAPLTSGNVLVPSIVAGLLAVGHAAFPSFINWSPSNGVNQPPPPSTPGFPQTR